MRHHHRLPHAVLLVLALSVSPACASHRAETIEEQPAPGRGAIEVHVRNDNYLDMNVSVVSHGTRRRLGTVNGNSSAKFNVAASSVAGSDFSLLATPIGGKGNAASGNLSVGEGQRVEFRIAQVLRQSMAIVR